MLRKLTKVMKAFIKLTRSIGHIKSALVCNCFESISKIRLEGISKQYDELIEPDGKR